MLGFRTEVLVVRGTALELGTMQMRVAASQPAALGVPVRLGNRASFVQWMTRAAGIEAGQPAADSAAGAKASSGAAQEAETPAVLKAAIPPASSGEGDEREESVSAEGGETAQKPVGAQASGGFKALQFAQADAMGALNSERPLMGSAADGRTHARFAARPSGRKPGDSPICAVRSTPTAMNSKGTAISQPTMQPGSVDGLSPAGHGLPHGTSLVTPASAHPALQANAAEHALLPLQSPPPAMATTQAPAPESTAAGEKTANQASAASAIAGIAAAQPSTGHGGMVARAVPVRMTGVGRAEASSVEVASVEPAGAGDSIATTAEPAAAIQHPAESAVAGHIVAAAGMTNQGHAAPGAVAVKTATGNAPRAVTTKEPGALPAAPDAATLPRAERPEAEPAASAREKMIVRPAMSGAAVAEKSAPSAGRAAPPIAGTLESGRMFSTGLTAARTTEATAAAPAANAGGASGVPAGPAHAAVSAAGGGSPGAVLERMDAAPAPQVMVSAPHRLAVGVRNEGLGWVEIRTQAAGGQVSAVVATSAGEAHAALHASLPEMRDYLAGQQVHVDRLGAEAYAAGGNGREAASGGSGRSGNTPTAAGDSAVAAEGFAGEDAEETVSLISVRA